MLRPLTGLPPHPVGGAADRRAEDPSTRPEFTQGPAWR